MRAYQFLMPTQQMRAARVPSIVPAGGPTRVEGHIWVPIDDTTTWSYNWFYAYETDGTFTPEQRAEREQRAGRGFEDLLPGYRSKRNRSNDYQIDRERQRTTSFTGIDGVNTQDMAVQEGMGPIVDRTREHLGTTDRPVIVMRQMLLEAVRQVAEGTAPRGSRPESYRAVRPLDHFIGRELDWKKLPSRTISSRSSNATTLGQGGTSGGTDAGNCKILNASGVVADGLRMR